MNQNKDSGVQAGGLTYLITPRPAHAGGGWRLQLFQGGQEVGGGAYPVTSSATSDDAYQDAMDDGESWLLSRGDAPAPTSYGLPARIDGMDPDHLRALLPLAVANAGTREAMARLVALDTLSAMLWLYRRLPRAYGRQAHVDVVIERLAGQTGADVAGDLAERGTAPNEQTDNEGKGSSNAN